MNFKNWTGLSGVPNLIWMPEKVLESKGGQCDFDHVTHRLPFRLLKIEARIIYEIRLKAFVYILSFKFHFFY